MVSQNQMDYRQFCYVCFLNPNSDREKRCKNYKFIRTLYMRTVGVAFIMFTHVSPSRIFTAASNLRPNPFSVANAGQTAQCTQGFGGNEGINGKALSLVAIGVEVKWTALSLSVGPVFSGA